MDRDGGHCRTQGEAGGRAGGGRRAMCMVKLVAGGKVLRRLLMKSDV